MNKIFYGISIGLVVAICVALIGSAIIPYRFSDFNAMGIEKPLQIKIYQDSSTADPLFYYNDSTGEEKEEYNKYFKAIKNSFSTTIINALFTKNLGEKASYEYANENIDDVISESDNAIEFFYNQEQQLKKNDKNFILNEMVNNPNYQNGSIKFKSIYFTWDNEKEDGFKQMNIFVKKLVTNASTDYAVVKITTLSNINIK